MKTVLIISVSPRKGGNSDLLCDRFAEGATEAGNEVEKVFLKDHNINYCQGCGA
jgi:multimeric flavodoxin WrbA